MPRIGIDLGTTNTLAALVYDDGPHVIPRGAGRTCRVSSGSARARDDDGRGGREADNAGERVVRSVKRLMGRTYSEAKGEGAREVLPRLREPRPAGRQRPRPRAARRRRLRAPPLAARGQRAHPGPRAPPRRDRARGPGRFGGDHGARLLPRSPPQRDPRRGAARRGSRSLGGDLSTSRAPPPSPSLRVVGRGPGRAGAGRGLGRRAPST